MELSLWRHFHITLQKKSLPLKYSSKITTPSSYREQLIFSEIDIPLWRQIMLLQTFGTMYPVSCHWR